VVKIHEKDTVKCASCKVRITLDLDSRTAYERDDPAYPATVLVVQHKRTRRGERYGLLRRILWLCPSCGKVHEREEWTPDKQSMLKGFDWR